MTSSLVGSEMCIRDRLKMGASMTEISKNMKNMDRGMEYVIEQVDTLEPVSYTHLTLPTICSV
eukprot:10587547-Prorocentrum_lima.AAC.1